MLDDCEKNSLEAVVQVLLLTVYADRVKKTPEIPVVHIKLFNMAIFTEDAFKDHSGDLKPLIEKYDAQVRDVIDHSDLLEITDTALNRIDDPMMTPLLIAAMRSVALSDGEFHHNENILIQRAEEIWGMAAS